MIYTTSDCRVCGYKLTPLYAFNLTLTGTFPRPEDPPLEKGPVTLCKCPFCDLIQLWETYDPSLLFGDNYGYRSGLNGSMVHHLHEVATWLTRKVDLQQGDWICDIGSNDGTLLNSFVGFNRVGYDPTIFKFAEFYEPDILKISNPFNLVDHNSRVGKRVKLVTSIAMFYDLQDPVEFAQQVAATLHEDGIWYTEQAYLPAMLRNNAYDAICQEHLTYYRLTDIHRIAKAADLTIRDVTFNEVNGGSFGVVMGHGGTPCDISGVLEEEKRLDLDRFVKFIEDHPAKIHKLLSKIPAVVGYGASTKGNVLLQHCGITPKQMVKIVEVNPDKFGRVTPGTRIPIVSEGHSLPPHYLVLPWHFRTSILKRTKDWGARFIFPLPEVEVCGHW